MSEKIVKCNFCRKESTIEIPIKPIPNLKYNSDFIESYEVYSFNIKNVECPHCKKLGGLYVPYTKQEAPFIFITNLDPKYYPLALRFPSRLKIKGIEFKSGEHYYIYSQILTKEDKETFLRFTKLTEQRKLLETVEHSDVDKYDVLEYIIQERIKQDEKFKTLLKSVAGKKIKYSSNDDYLGVVRKGYNSVSGQNTYGKLLMRYSNMLEDEDEI